MPKISTQYEQAQQMRIIDGAARVFAEHGYSPTTIDQIGQALQLSKGAIYIYFKSKEELFVSVLRSIYEGRFIVLSTAYLIDDPILVKFEKILERLGGLVDHEDYVFIRLWLEGFLESEHIPSLEAIKTDSHQQFYTLLYGLLEEGQLSGEINPHINLSSVTSALMAVSDGLMLHSLVQGWGIDPQQVRKIIQDTFAPMLENTADKPSQL
ncbi:MAG: TetR/AcrR family transcriptional regulator [Anaerolineaceae bacterium]|nr:TetR/AcrR family transcriptional regulator [Anaerolineaceae bacterium]